MKRRTFFKQAGKGAAGIAAGAFIPRTIAREHVPKEEQKRTVEIKIHPLSVSRKEKKNRSHGSR